MIPRKFVKRKGHLGPKWPRSKWVPNGNESSENTAWEVPCRFRMIPWHYGCVRVLGQLQSKERWSLWKKSPLGQGCLCCSTSMINCRIWGSLNPWVSHRERPHTKQTLEVWHSRQCSMWMNSVCSTFFGLPVNMESYSLCFQRDPQPVFNKWQYQPWAQVFSSRGSANSAILYSFTNSFGKWKGSYCFQKLNCINSKLPYLYNWSLCSH